MKLIVFLTLFNAVLSEQSTNEVHGITIATIWNRNSSAIISFFRFASIVSEKFILVVSYGMGNLANYGVAYGLYDISEVNIQNTLVPKKLIRNDKLQYLSLLQMQKIGCNARLACIPVNFNFNNKKLTTIGYSIESGKIKSFDVNKVELSECDKRYIYMPKDKEFSICLSRKQEKFSHLTPFQWYNTEDRKWYVVAIQCTGEQYNIIPAFNISHFKPWIQKVVEDGTTDALC